MLFTHFPAAFVSRRVILLDLETKSTVFVIKLFLFNCNFVGIRKEKKMLLLDINLA